MDFYKSKSYSRNYLNSEPDFSIALSQCGHRRWLAYSVSNHAAGLKPGQSRDKNTVRIIHSNTLAADNLTSEMTFALLLFPKTLLLLFAK